MSVLAPPSIRKVTVTDMRTHTSHVIEGPNDFYGYPLNEKGQIGPKVLFSVLHPEDRETFIDVVERCAMLKGGEELTYRLRARHRLGHWLQAECRTTAIEWDERGLASKIQSEVLMTEL